MSIRLVHSTLSHLHAENLATWFDGAVLEGKFILTYDSPTVFVPCVSHNVEIRSPHLKLSLPVDDGGEWRTDQKRPFGVTLKQATQLHSVPFFSQMHLKES